jgi:hypothetical protein
MKKLIAPLALGALLSALALATLAAITIAASGTLATRPGAWTTRVTIAPHASFAVNVPGLLRLATTPLGLWVLDGQTRKTPFGQLQFRRANHTLIVYCAPCLIDDRRLHTQAVTIDSVELRLTPRDAATFDGWLETGGVVVPFSARLRVEGIDVDWSLASTDMAAIYRVLAQAIPEAAVATIDGRIQAKGTLKLPAFGASTQVSIEGFAVGGLGTERLQFGSFRFNCNGDGASRPQLVGDGQKHWMAADKLGTLLPAAVLAAEDQRFGTHPGYDADEIAHALASTAPRGPERGASTITQQLARTIFTGPDRTAVRKQRELLYAVEMERTLGKARIFELYLNTVDWGPGICGANAAARIYFKKPPAKLTSLEAAWLAGILRNPHAAYRQQFLSGIPNRDRAQQVLVQMRLSTKPARLRAQQGPLVFARAPVSELHAPELARSVAH